MMAQAWIIVDDDDDPEFSGNGRATIVLTEPERWEGGTIIPIVYQKLEQDNKDF